MGKYIRIIVYIAVDVLAFHASYFLAWQASAGGASAGADAERFLNLYPTVFLILILVKLAVFFVAGIYRILFEYADRGDYRRLLLATGAATLAAVTGAALAGMAPATDLRFVVFSLVFDVVLVFGLRVALLLAPAGGLRGRASADADAEARASRRSMRLRRSSGLRGGARRVMIVGTATAAADLIEEITGDPSLRMKPEIVVDEDARHEGASIHGVETVAGLKELRVIARRRQIDEILIANPQAGRRQIAATLRECVKTRCRILLLPPRRSRALRESQNGPVRLRDLVPPTMQDWFGRERPHIDHKAVGELIRGRVVLVTGGAGAYGTELCRQILRYKPRRLIALDVSEDALAMLAAEIGFSGGAPREAGDPEFRTVIASVRDAETMRRVFSAFRPHLVFHAAELKQIPLIQANPREAFLTNIVGLQICADLADEFSAEKLVLGSTVRARVPVSVAAACKRVAEMYALEKDAHSEAAYAVVRFPNLIEARGNVLDIFARQIEAGGPVTVADENLVREFVSAEEAALLTLQAAALSEGGEIFEVGPGERAEISELAEAMIRLAGYAPYDEVDVVITQLRSGERLYEDAAVSAGQLEPVSDRLWYAMGGTVTKLPHWSELWYQDPGKMDDAAAVALLQKIFPTTNKATSATQKQKTMRGERIESE